MQKNFLAISLLMVGVAVTSLHGTDTGKPGSHTGSPAVSHKNVIDVAHDIKAVVHSIVHGDGGIDGRLKLVEIELNTAKGGVEDLQTRMKAQEDKYYTATDISCSVDSNVGQEVISLRSQNFARQTEISALNRNNGELSTTVSRLQKQLAATQTCIVKLPSWQERSFGWATDLALLQWCMNALNPGWTLLAPASKIGSAACTLAKAVPGVGFAVNKVVMLGTPLLTKIMASGVAMKTATVAGVVSPWVGAIGVTGLLLKTCNDMRIEKGFSAYHDERNAAYKSAERIRLDKKSTQTGTTVSSTTVVSAPSKLNEIPSPQQPAQPGDVYKWWSSVRYFGSKFNNNLKLCVACPAEFGSVVWDYAKGYKSPVAPVIEASKSDKKTDKPQGKRQDKKLESTVSADVASNTKDKEEDLD